MRERYAGAGDDVPVRPAAPAPALALAAEAGAAAAEGAATKPLKVIVAGGGIGGLTFALAAQERGLDVQVFERVKQYKPFGGPIQMQCNALGALEAISPAFAEDVISTGCVTGDRINGLLDGVSGRWWMRFDTRQPCRRNGLPLTLVINRPDLLQMLLDALRPGVVERGIEVMGYTQDETGITATLSDGRTVHGDVLVASDGIRSKCRAQFKGPEDADNVTYSGYTVYTACPEYEPETVEKIGYQVFLGGCTLDGVNADCYFVASDVGNGRSQYYAFHREPPGGVDTKPMKERLLEIFDGWSDDVIGRIQATKNEDLERRDIFDRRPTLSWLDGRLALLGDAAHAVQPNMGQGGCQAIEDAYALATELQSLEAGASQGAVQGALRQYAFRRVLRAGSVHGFSRLAPLANDLYRPFLGSDPYSWYPKPVQDACLALEKAKIPHPGRVFGQVGMMFTMDGILEYIGAGNVFGVALPPLLGGRIQPKEEERVPYCQVPGVAPNIARRPITDEDFTMKGLPGFAE